MTTNNSALGYTLSALEIGTAQGIVTLLPETAIASLPVSLTTPIPAANSTATGMHLWIRVWNHTASGTIAIAGTAPNSLGAVTSTTITLAVPLQNDNPYADYITPEIYGAVSASGVTLGGGLTNGRVVIYGITAAAGNRLMAGEFKLIDKRTDHTVVQQRGDFAQSHMAPIPLVSKAEFDFQCDLQPDTCYFVVPAGINSTVTTTALPAGGTSLLASTSVVTGGTVSATTQPTTPGMVVQITLAGGPATAATVSVTGTNLDGETVTEIVVPNTKTAGTWTSNTVFASIAASGIAYGAFGGAATIVVTGFFGWQYQATMGAETLSTLSFFQYDGTASKVAPFGLLNQWEVTGGMDKEAKFAAKGMAQLIGLVGDTTSAARQGPALTQSQDQAMSGWETVIYFDGIAGTVGTTQQQDVMDYKIACDLKWETKNTSQFIPPSTFYSRAYRGRHLLSVEFTVDMTTATYDSLYAKAFKKGVRQLVQIHARQKGAICTIAGTPYYLGVKFNAVFRMIDDPQLDYSISKPNVEIKVKGEIYKDDTIGYDLQALWVTRRPSW